MIIDSIKEFSKYFLEKINKKKIHVVSHYDCDGITSAAIISKTLERLNIEFTLKILKQLTKHEINLFPKNKILFLLDLGSSDTEELSSLKTESFILDHHEINYDQKYNNINIINPHLFSNQEDLCTAELSYLFSKSVSEQNKNLAHLAVLGMVGDIMEKEITLIRKSIIDDANITIKKGLLIYPSTRPIDKALEYSSRPYIPGVTGDPKGTYEILKDSGIEKGSKSYKSLIELSDEEMKKLTTNIMLRLSAKESSEYIGNLYLIKLFNKIEDAREISSIINACSRMDNPEIGLMFCLGNSDARKKAERIYVKYRQNIISALRYIEEEKKIQGKKYVIINAKDKIKDTLIGTLASILSFSRVYEEGTIIVAMAYDNERIKVSTRFSGRNPKTQRNLKELLDSITYSIGGDCGGHKKAAGCTIDKANEEKFIELLQKKLEVEMIKV